MDATPPPWGHRSHLRGDGPAYEAEEAPLIVLAGKEFLDHASTRGEGTSAWSTEGPCAPSLARTCDAPSRARRA